MCKCQMLCVAVVGLVVLSGGYAAADTIIDPITPTTTSGFSSQLVSTSTPYYDASGYGYQRWALMTIDGSGLSGGLGSLPTGSAVPGTWPTHDTGSEYSSWLTNGAAQTDGALSAAYITYDLGANYNLTGMHVWNYNNAGHTSDRGADHVIVSVTSVANPGAGDWTTVSYTYGGNSTTQFVQATGASSYAGADYGLTYNNVRMVKFDITDTFSAATPGYVGLAEVRFIGSPTPEPSTIVLLATGLIGLLAYAWRKRK